MAIPLTLALALVPTLFVTCFVGFSEKPGLAEAAAAADRQFGANSLLVSAWELSRSRSAVPPTAKLLLRRCEAALPGWSQSGRRKTRENLGPTGMAIVTLAAVGIFFLSQPAPIQTHQLAKRGVTGSPEEQREDSASDAARVLGNLLETGPPRQTQDRGESDVLTSRSAPPAGAAEGGEFAEDRSNAKAAADAIPAEKRSQASLAADSSTGLTQSRTAGEREGARIPSREAGNESATPPDSRQLRAGDYERIELVAIETKSTDGASSRDGSAPASRLIESAPNPEDWKNASSSAGGELAASGFVYLLSPQQRSLVWRYLQRLEKNHVPTN
jgi:hypothetical protein